MIWFLTLPGCTYTGILGSLSRRNPAGAMESIDDLLAQVKAEYKAKPQDLPPPSPVPSGVTPIDLSTSPSVDRLLAELGGEYREKEKAAAQERQQQQEEERRQQERCQQLQRQALQRDAAAWLKKLDPLSGEGLWFADFAKGYSSRLEAAIDYLEALKEVQP